MNMSFVGGMFDNIQMSGIGTGVGVGIMVALIVVMIVAAVAVNVVPRVVHKWEIEYRTRDLTYGAVCLAMSYALSWARMFEMPLGGSVTPAALAPLFIYCYYFGFRKGFAVSSAYMLLQFTQGVYVAHPLSAFFDYILPCSAICIVGLFGYKPAKYAAFVKRGAEKPDGVKNSAKYWAYTIGGHWGIFAGAGIYTVVRYISLVMSGVLCWDYWGYGASPLAYKLTFSLSYNSFSLVDSVIAVVAVALLLSSRAFNLYMSASFADKSAFIAARAATGAAGEAASTDSVVSTDEVVHIDESAAADGEADSDGAERGESRVE